MKRLLLLLLLVCSASAWAQDVIVKQDGSTILCRVVEVNKTEVVYKRWTNLNGPNYVMNLSDLTAINYENGEKIRMDETQKSENTPATTSRPLPTVQKNTGQQTMSDDALFKMVGKPELAPEEKIRKAKKLKTAGWVIGGVLVAGGIVLVALGPTIDDYDTEYYSYDAPTDWLLTVHGIVFIAGGVATTSACLVRAGKLKKQASQLSVQTAPLYQHDFTLKNGTSLSAGVDMLKDNTRRNATLGIGLSYNF